MSAREVKQILVVIARAERLDEIRLSTSFLRDVFDVERLHRDRAYRFGVDLARELGKPWRSATYWVNHSPEHIGGHYVRVFRNMDTRRWLRFPTLEQIHAFDDERLPVYDPRQPK